MIQRLEMSGVHTVLTDDLKKYIIKKIGRLDRFVPRQSRESVHAEVYVKESKAKDNNKCICEVVLKLPRETITVTEATVNMFAAIDIVEHRLQNLLKKYKETHADPRLHRRLATRLSRNTA